MSDRLEDVVDIALRVAEALEKVGASYFVGGSLASSIDGEPRATNDIDFVIDMAVGKVRELSELLGADFEVDGDMLRGAILRPDPTWLQSNSLYRHRSEGSCGGVVSQLAIVVPSPALDPPIHYHARVFAA
jgi:hypothetical protein